MVGHYMDKSEHVIDSNTRRGTQRRKNHLGKYQTLGMYPVGSCACLQQELAQHLLSYHPATSGAKRNLWRLRCSCQRAPEQSNKLNGYMESSNYGPSPLVSQAVTFGIAGSGHNRCIQLIDRIKNTNIFMET